MERYLQVVQLCYNVDKSVTIKEFDF